jgi:hypothetical protein
MQCSTAVLLLQLKICQPTTRKQIHLSIVKSLIHESREKTYDLQSFTVTTASNPLRCPSATMDSSNGDSSVNPPEMKSPEEDPGEALGKWYVELLRITSQNRSLPLTFPCCTDPFYVLLDESVYFHNTVSRLQASVHPLRMRFISDPRMVCKS